MEGVMRRVLITAALAAGLLLIAAPAQAFAHNAVQNAYLHTALDVLSLLVVASPALSIKLWGARRRSLLLALIGVVQLPVAVIGFMPFANPVLHVAASTLALALTAGAIWAVRRVGYDTAVTAPARQST
jgi:hypothetical protein